MSNKLVKELQKKREKRLNQEKRALRSQHKIIDNVERFLLESHNEDLEILEKLGLDHQIKYMKKLNSDVKRNKIQEKLYNKPTYTGAELKQLCNKYDLRVLPIDKYNGSIPSDLVRIINEFCSKHDLLIQSKYFYIMAPVEQFNTVKHVPIDMDPILFYVGDKSRYDNAITEDDIFTSIHNWGNDFTFMRTFRWLFYDFAISYNSTPTALFTILWAAVFIITSIATIFTSPGGTITANILFSIVSSILIYNLVSDGKNGYNDLWNTNLR